MNDPSIIHTFTKIADSQSNFGHFDFGGFDTSPAINDNGTVAFQVNLLDLNGFGIFTGNGRNITREYIATPNLGSIATNNAIDINNKGALAFTLEDDPSSAALPNILVSRNEEVSNLGNGLAISHVAINNRGTVAFAQGDGRSLFFEVQTISRNGSRTTIASSFDPLTYELVFSELEGASLNDQGQVAFSGSLYVAEGPDIAGIFVGDQAKPTNTFKTIADSSGNFDRFGLFPAINNNGLVAFSATLDDESSGIFVGDYKKRTNKTITIADNNSLFDTFEDVALNNRGEIAFEASLDTGDFGIFTGSDPIADKVIATGDPLFGSTVTDLEFFIEGFNNSGQIAFIADLANGNEVIVRANPRKAFVIEAESLDLDNYRVENTPLASNDQIISLQDNSGSASTQFTGPSGRYDILVGYYDEIDGESLFKFKVNDRIKDQWKADQELDPHGFVPTENNFTQRVITGIYLKSGDTLEIEGFRDQEEYARIDFLKLISSAGDRPGLGNTDLFSSSLMDSEPLGNSLVINSSNPDWTI